MTKEEVAAALARLDERVTAVAAIAEARDVAAAERRAEDERIADRRFEGVNEFRAQLSDQAAHFATRETIDAVVTGLRERHDADIAANRRVIDDVRDRIRSDLAEVRTQVGRLLFAIGITVIGALLTALIAHLITTN